MRCIRIALTAAVAACLPLLATPALAELGHAADCARCGGAYYTPYGDYGLEGVPAFEPETSIPPAATALVPAAPAPVSRCEATLYGARHQLRLSMCRL
jgi:hypothetical protein